MSASAEVVEPNPAERDALEESYGRFVNEVVERGWTGSFSPSWKP
jgi:hypothetical protein